MAYGYRQPRELLRETAGDYECVIYGSGKGSFGRIAPAMFIRQQTGPGLLDWTDVQFRQAPHPATLRRAWTEFKSRIASAP